MTRETTTPGGRLREHREAAGLTRDDAARRLGVSVRTLARWESGESYVPADALSKLESATSRFSSVAGVALVDLTSGELLDLIGAAARELGARELAGHQVRISGRIHAANQQGSGSPASK